MSDYARGRGKQTGRQLSILRYLARQGRLCSTQEIIEELGISQRTAYRDLEQLCALGCPLEHDASPGGGWRVRRKQLIDWIFK